MKQSGNIFFLLFAAVGMAGVVGVSIQQYVMSPLKTASSVTRKNSAETQMQLGIRVAATNAVTQQALGGDCDSDGMVEPMPYVDAGANPHPVGGGFLPNNIGSVQNDPWSTRYGYCVWDHGSAIDDAGCGGAPQLRLPGTNGQEWDAMAVISAGPDKVFQTSCNAWADLDANNLPDTPLVNKPTSSDDVYYSWSYKQASAVAPSLWTLETLDPSTAEIDKNLSVKDGGSVEQLGFDATTKALTVGTGGRGEFPTIRTDYIQALTNPSIQLLDAIQFAPADGLSGNTYPIINATGDSLVISNGTRTVFEMNSITPFVRFAWSNNASVNNTLMNVGTLGPGPVFSMRHVLNSNAPMGLTFQNWSGSNGLTNSDFISGSHAATNGDIVPTSRIVMGIEAAGAAPQDMASYIAFQTRPAGVALGGALPERMRITAAGNIGVGTTNPQGRFHVNGNAIIENRLSSGITNEPATAVISGTVIVGSGATACSYTTRGGLRYSSTLKCHEFCDGANWSCISTAVCATSTPNNFNFTNVTNAPKAVWAESDIRQVTGIGTCSVFVRLFNIWSIEFVQTERPMQTVIILLSKTGLLPAPLF
jgi:hypothetical protein